MAKDTIRLKAPPGTDEANNGTDRFRVDNDGHVEVPPEAVEALVNTGGFVVDEPEPDPVEPDPDAPAPEPDPLATVAHATDPAASFTFDGVSYDAEDGKLRIPHAAVHVAASHGFSPVAE